MAPTRLAVAAVFMSLSEVAPDNAPWNGESVNDLHNEYYNIFKTGNRNAASHLWSKFLLDRSTEMSPEKLRLMFSGFCAVSGSPVQPSDSKRYRVTLETVGKEMRTGYMYHCCWPCICDTQDYIKVDTKSVTTAGGETRQYHFAVLGDPCEYPEALAAPFPDAIYGGQDTTLSLRAPEIACDGDGRLEGAPRSDHGYVIVSMFFDEEDQVSAIDASSLKTNCQSRAEANYNSGMGQIFRQVASINPIVPGNVSGRESGASAASGVSAAPGVSTTSVTSPESDISAASSTGTKTMMTSGSPSASLVCISVTLFAGVFSLTFFSITFLLVGA